MRLCRSEDMDWFHYRDGQLYCEDVQLNALAQQVGTPVYVYSQRTLVDHYDRLAAAFAPLNPIICYSIKSCANIHICQLLAKRGAGMDVVSGGELYRAKQAGADMDRVVYAGVGKTDAEIQQAVTCGIGWFNIESDAEFENIARITRQMGAVTHAALRINPSVDPQTHAKTATGKRESKFGVDIDQAQAFFERYGKDANCRITGIHLHLGSPIYRVEPYLEAITKALELIDQLRAQGYSIDVMDIGGGFGADYETDQSPLAADYAQQIVPLLQPFVDCGGRVILEPGRTITANAGILLTRVQYIKFGGQKKFVIVDSGMHHLIRPTLYESFHFIWPTEVAPEHEPKYRKAQMEMPGLESSDVVGPVCESGDYLAQNRRLPPLARDELLCVFSAGAYGMVMASNYNTMPRPPEVLVHGDDARFIRRRETYEDMLALERDGQDV